MASDGVRWAFSGAAPLDEQRELLGRDEDVECLLNLIFARRIVLLHGPSGSGKSSLICARRGLKAALETGKRDQTEIPKHKPVHYILLTELIGGKDESAALQEQLKAFGEQVGKEPSLLIVDQLEQYLQRGLDSPRRVKELFERLQSLLSSHRSLALLLVIQERYLAALQNLLLFTPEFFETTYRLGLLDEASPAAQKNPMGQSDRGRQVIASLLAASPHVSSARLNDPLLGCVRKLAERLRSSGIDPLHIQLAGRILEGEAAARDDSGKEPADNDKRLSELSDAIAQQDLEQVFVDRALQDATRGTGLQAWQLGHWLYENFLSTVASVESESPVPSIPIRPRRLRKAKAQLASLPSSSRWYKKSLPTDRVIPSLVSWGVLRQVSLVEAGAFELAHDRLLPAIDRYRRRPAAVPAAVPVLAALLTFALGAGGSMFGVMNSAQQRTAATFSAERKRLEGDLVTQRTRQEALQASAALLGNQFSQEKALTEQLRKQLDSCGQQRDEKSSRIRELEAQQKRVRPRLPGNSVSPVEVPPCWLSHPGVAACLSSFKGTKSDIKDLKGKCMQLLAELGLCSPRPR